MNITLNLKERILELDGSDANFSVGDALATIVSSSVVGGRKRMYELAADLKQKSTLELTRPDFNLIRGVVDVTNAFSGSLVPGQLLSYMDRQFNASEAKAAWKSADESGADAAPKKSKK